MIPGVPDVEEELVDFKGEVKLRGTDLAEGAKFTIEIDGVEEEITVGKKALFDLGKQLDSTTEYTVKYVEENAENDNGDSVPGFNITYTKQVKLEDLEADPSIGYTIDFEATDATTADMSVTPKYYLADTTASSLEEGDLLLSTKLYKLTIAGKEVAATDFSGNNVKIKEIPIYQAETAQAGEEDVLVSTLTIPYGDGQTITYTVETPKSNLTLAKIKDGTAFDGIDNTIEFEDAVISEVTGEVAVTDIEKANIEILKVDQLTRGTATLAENVEVDFSGDKYTFIVENVETNLKASTIDDITAVVTVKEKDKEATESEEAEVNKAKTYTKLSIALSGLNTNPISPVLSKVEINTSTDIATAEQLSGQIVLDNAVGDTTRASAGSLAGYELQSATVTLYDEAGNAIDEPAIEVGKDGKFVSQTVFEASEGFSADIEITATKQKDGKTLTLNSKMRNVSINELDAKIEISHSAHDVDTVDTLISSGKAVPLTATVTAADETPDLPGDTTSTIACEVSEVSTNGTPMTDFSTNNLTIEVTTNDTTNPTFNSKLEGTTTTFTSTSKYAADVTISKVKATFANIVDASNATTVKVKVGEATYTITIENGETEGEAITADV